jgi:hypothetical protein
MKTFRTFLALFGCALLGILLWWKAFEGPRAKDDVAKSSLVQEGLKQNVRKISMSVRNGAGLDGKELLTEIFAEGVFHQGPDKLTSVTFQNVSGTIEGQGDIVPPWQQFEEGTLVMDMGDSESRLAWQGKTIGAVEWNILRLLANGLPPIDRFDSESKVSYEWDDLYGSGNWVWVASKSQNQSIKWTSSFVPKKTPGDNFWKRDSLWTIFKKEETFHVVGHDVMGIAVKGGGNLVIDSRSDIQLGSQEKSSLDLNVYSNLVFLPLRPGVDQVTPGLTGSAKTKEQLIKDLKESSKDIYFEFKRSLDQGEWVLDEMMNLVKALDRKSQGYRDLLGALAQTKSALGKEFLLSLAKEKWDRSDELVGMIPLLGQGPGYNQDVIDWLGYASENHASEEVRTTSRLASGTVAHNLRESHPDVAQKILDESFDRLRQSTDKNETSMVTDMLAAIGNSGGEGIESKLEAWYGHQNSEVRAAAYFALRHESNQQKAVQRLLMGMEDSSRLVRSRAVEALETMKLTPEQVKALQSRAQQEKDPQVKSALNEILGQNRSKI